MIVQISIYGDCMKIVLVSGGMHQVIADYDLSAVDIINHYALSFQEVLPFLQDVNPEFAGMLITDEALLQDDLQEKDILQLLDYLAEVSPSNQQPQVILLTRDFVREVRLKAISNKYRNFRIIISDDVRIPVALYKQVLEELAGHKQLKVEPKTESKKASSDEVKSKKSFLDRFRAKPKHEEQEPQATDQLSRQIEGISRGISRVVAITGHRGSGLTSTAVNVAYEASKRGLKTILVDMDVVYRSTNMYFSSFHELTQKDEEMNASLIHTLARPQDYRTTAFPLQDHLWMTSLGYSFHNARLVEQFYNNAKFTGLLSLLRTQFNLVILDMPIELFRTFKESMIHLDVFGLCVSNNLHSVLSTLRSIDVILERESATYLNAKSKVIITRYNDRSRFQNESFIPEKVADLLSSGLSRNFSMELKIAGYVPYSPHFDAQIETDIPAVNASSEFEQAFANIVLRLMEGA